MSSENYEVIIVGGGMGGLNLAALLTHAGKKASWAQQVNEAMRQSREFLAAHGLG